MIIRLRPPDNAEFAPFGRLVEPPEMAGKRAFFSENLQERPGTSSPVLHVNKVEPSTLPLQVSGVERHAYASQCFFPLDVQGYITLVMPSDANGMPKPEESIAFLMPGTRGVIYHPGVWHMGATVLERAGNFVVLMWRGGPQQDDEFHSIPTLTLIS
ncbi:MAG: ureidoglycolate lyase [Pseudomonadota bacterium]